MCVNFSFAQITNVDVIKMSKAGLSQDVILSKISTEPPNFKTDIDDLIFLKSNKVADTVINLIVFRQKSFKNSASDLSKKNSDGENFIFPYSGIYFKENDNYTSLDPTLVSFSTQRGIYLTSIYIGQIEGSKANYVLNNNPEFYFNFDESKKSLNSANPNDVGNQSNYLSLLSSLNSHAISPNEFKLLKLDVKKSLMGLGKNKEQREYIAGKINAGKTDLSIDSRYIVNFKYKKISENTYKINFPDGLVPGQYCFVYSGNVQSTNNLYNGNKIKVFDFSIE